MGRQPEQFCRRGHDTFLVGRDASYECKECRRWRDRRRNPKRRALEAARGGRVPKKGYDRPDWERARVHRWLEIVTANPLTKQQSTIRRSEEFEELLAMLEADLPTPDDETVDA